ncbi:hypothetical protein ES288_A12G090100v1 [Gossypium darwinii]|uniref:Uncharacterized protein n=1 Tax=Gossypium darwinii TaxID=34276 RepID=A0A5D2E7M0_GOSDA|nr:hypothetical protein ES288_A12G090100v1 [Gossypium darwinii]
MTRTSLMADLTRIIFCRISTICGSEVRSYSDEYFLYLLTLLLLGNGPLSLLVYLHVEIYKR